MSMYVYIYMYIHTYIYELMGTGAFIGRGGTSVTEHAGNALARNLSGASELTLNSERTCPALYANI